MCDLSTILHSLCIFYLTCATEDKTIQLNRKMYNVGYEYHLLKVVFWGGSFFFFFFFCAVSSVQFDESRRHEKQLFGCRGYVIETKKFEVNPEFHWQPMKVLRRTLHCLTRRFAGRSFSINEPVATKG